MTVELRPLGVRCNLQCQYCYQNPQRDAGNDKRAYDIDKMKAAIAVEGGPFSLFGGEPLLVPVDDLEELWRWGLERYGRNGIQTNGVLVDERHIAMFRKYKVGIGISIDGPGALNDARWHGTLERTREATARTEETITRLCKEGMPPSLIITLNGANAGRDQLPVLLDWMRDLEVIGIRSIRLHLLEVESPVIRAKYALSTEDNVAALQAFMELARGRPRLGIDLFADMRALLLGRDEQTTCVWNGCDPYTTRAVRGVEGQGQRSNCGRTNKDGIDFAKADMPGFERYLALHATPQDAGGCKDCRFFMMCKGHCPGTAIDGDWRNRTEHCQVWFSIFEAIERQLVAQGKLPLSLEPRRPALEQMLIEAWARGEALSIRRVLALNEMATVDRGKTDWRSEIKLIREELANLRHDFGLCHA